MKPLNTLSLTIGLLFLTACIPSENKQDQQIAENEKKIELLRQEAEIKRLQEEINQLDALSASDVYQLSEDAVDETLSAEAQEKGKNGEIVQGEDGQQYMFDQSTGNWLLYGAIGAGLGYLAAQMANNRSKYTPVQRPTAAVERVVKDYKTQQTNTLRAQSPNTQKAAPRSNMQNSKPAANQQYRQTQKGYSNHKAPTRRIGRRR